MVDYRTLTPAAAEQLERENKLEQIGKGTYNIIYAPIPQETSPVAFRVSEDAPASQCVEYDNTLQAIQRIGDDADLKNFCVNVFGAQKVQHDGDQVNLSVKVELGVPIKDGQKFEDNVIQSLMDRYEKIRGKFALPDIKDDNFVTVGGVIKFADIDNLIKHDDNPAKQLLTTDHSEPATYSTISFVFKDGETEIPRQENGFIPHTWGNAVQLQSLLAFMQTCATFMGFDKSKFNEYKSKELPGPTLEVTNAPGANGTYTPEEGRQCRYVHTKDKNITLHTATRGVMSPKMAWVIKKAGDSLYETNFSPELRTLSKYRFDPLPLQQDWFKYEGQRIVPHEVHIAVKFSNDDSTRTREYIGLLESCQQKVKLDFPLCHPLFVQMIGTAIHLHKQLCESRTAEHVLTMASFVDLAR